MFRTAAAILFLLTLPSCIAAIGNTGTFDSPSASAAPLLRQKVDALRRIVELRKQGLDDVRSLQQAGRASDADVAGVEIALAEANIRLLDARIVLEAAEQRARD